MKNKKRKCNYQLKKRFKQNCRKSLINDILLLSEKDINDFAVSVTNLSKGDHLFVESTNLNDTYINNSGSNNEITVPNGYISVCYLLLNLIQYSESNLVKDSYILPALFCLRQYLELIMKKTILRFRNGETRPLDGESKFKTHDLIELWEKLKKHIDVINEETESIEQLLKELNEVDNDGTAFKYDYELNTIVRKKDQKKLNDLFDIDVLKTRVLQFYSFFEGMDSLSYVSSDSNE